MRWRFLPLPLVVLLGSGCAKPAGPVLRPGDVVRPEIAFAPQPPWPPGAAVTVGLLFKIERPRSDDRYLEDSEVRDPPVVRGRVWFFVGDRQLGEPLEVPFVRDC
jgi:hypothetical protein